MINKRHLAAELSIGVKRAVQEQKNGNETVSNDVTISLCNILEALFIHGLRESNFSKHITYHDKYPEPVWLRIALNDGLLESYVTSISREPQIVGHYYHRYAFMRDSEQMEVMSNYVRALSKLPFKAPVNSNMLNTWTPTPLQMAGLLTPATENFPRTSSDGSTPEMESLDVVEAMSALEFEGLDDVRMASESDSASVVFSTASPESVVPQGQTFLAADRSIFSDGGDSNLSSLPDTPSMLDEISQAVRLKTILDSFSDKNPSKDSSTAYNEQQQRQQGFVDSQVQNVKHIVDAKDSDAPVLSSSVEDDKTVQARNSLSNSSAERDEDEITPRVEEQMKNPFSTENNDLRTNNKISNASNVDSDLEFSFSPGNSLLGKNGWSTSQLYEENNDKSFEKSEEDERLICSSYSDSTNFSTALQNVLKTTSKIHADEIGVETKRSANSSNSNLSNGASPPKSKVSILVNAVNILRKNSSGCEIRGDESSLSSSPSKRISSGECTEEEKNNAEFVVVENNTNVNVEPAEKAFRMTFLTTVANEAGLSNQDYKCNSCKRSIGLMFGPYRMCHFDGHYYCSECHLNEESFIPSRILYCWDFKPRKVCRASKAFLDHVVDQPLIRLSQCNTTLADVVEKISEVNILRLELSYLAMYLLACRDIVAEDLRKRVWPKEYLYQDPDLFSVMDLINCSNGQLQKHLKSVISFATKHVLDTCRICSNKGFVCEICNDSKIIYPFQVELTQRCTKCYSVYHKGCAEGRPCPKCLRREMYSKNTLDSGIEMPPFADGL